MKRIASLLIGFILCCGLASAQTASGDGAARDKRRADKRLTVASSLALSEAEAKVFWPVYDGYQNRLSVINERVVALIERYATASRASGPDETQFIGMLKEFTQINDEEHKAGAALISEVGKVLPPSKAVRYLLIENRLRASEKSVVTEAVPLVAPSVPPVSPAPR